MLQMNKQYIHVHNSLKYDNEKYLINRLLIQEDNPVQEQPFTPNDDREDCKRHVLTLNQEHSDENAFII